MGERTNGHEGVLLQFAEEPNALIKPPNPLVVDQRRMLMVETSEEAAHIPAGRVSVSTEDATGKERCDAPVAGGETGDQLLPCVDVGFRNVVGGSPAVLSSNESCEKRLVSTAVETRGQDVKGKRRHTPLRLPLRDHPRALHNLFTRQLAVREELYRVAELAVKPQLDVCERWEEVVVEVAMRVDEDDHGAVG